MMSGEFLKSADFLAVKALETEANPPADVFERHAAHSAYVTGSIIASSTFLETKINELFCELSEIDTGRTWPEKTRLFQRLWKQGIPRTASYSTLKKYQLALILLGKDEMEPGRATVQDMTTVISLRNELIHYEYEYQLISGISSDFEEHFPLKKIISRTRGKFSLNPLCAPHAPIWPYKLLGAGCARWCVDASITFALEFVHRLPPSLSSQDQTQSLVSQMLKRRKTKGNVDNQ